ncbi:MAG TPA: NAD-dependent succinate-semialdehyde dehydrogenase [Kiritimatiellia bacterium]|nr:NAD-dependent succinate-semialdehyde dehydrogenase [Kiritimatiellia bacterium]
MPPSPPFFPSIQPSTGNLLAEHPILSLPAARQQLDHLQSGWTRWRDTPLAQRTSRLIAIADTLEARAHPLADLMADEMGKPVTQGQAEIKKCAWACRHAAELAPATLAPQPFPHPSLRGYSLPQPLGILLAIMPWNFPFWQFFRFAASSLVAGNAIAFKPAPNVIGCANALIDLLVSAGLPPYAVSQVPVTNETTLELIDHPAIRGITLTGSARAGRIVAARAGAALKKTVLELGGSDPYLILDDADLDLAVDACAASRMINSGQSCIAAKRFIVHISLADPFTRRLADKLRGVTCGDPRDPATTCGPLARADLRDQLHTQVRQSIDQGARCLLGGELPSGPGFFYPPTLLHSVAPDMPVAAQETFGPVASILIAEDDLDAVRLANASPYGLGAAVFSRDPRRAEHLLLQLDAGACAANQFVQSDPRLPFGGIKQSGYGRELGPHGILEFTNLKTVQT